MTAYDDDDEKVNRKSAPLIWLRKTVNKLRFSDLCSFAAPKVDFSRSAPGQRGFVGFGWIGMDWEGLELERFALCMTALQRLKFFSI